MKQATGIEKDYFWTLLLSVVSYWRELNEDSIQYTAKTLNKNELFGEEVNVDQEQVSKFLSTASKKAEHLREDVLEKCSQEPGDSYFLIPFCQKPLVQFEDRIYCLSA